MGLFDSEYKTSVGASASRVIPDTLLPQSYKVGAIKAILRDGTVSEYIMTELVMGMGLKCEKAYEYGKNGYVFGVPTAKWMTPSTGATVVAGLMTTIAGSAATISYNHFGPLNHLHYGWYVLRGTYGYTEETNTIGTLTAVKGTTVYLKNMVSVVKNVTAIEATNGSLSYWGTSPQDGPIPGRGKAVTFGTREVWIQDTVGQHQNTGHFETQTYQIGSPREFTATVIDPAVTYDCLRVFYVWMVAGVLHEETMDIPIVEPTVAEDYFQVKYYAAGIAHYFLYKYGSGTYSELDVLYNHTYDTAGTYFPNIYFRLGHAAISNTTQVASSTTMCKKLGIDYAAVGTAIATNPGIGDVEQAMIVMGITAVTTNKLEQKYLFDFFKAAYFQAEGIGVDTAAIYNSVNVSSPWGYSPQNTASRITLSIHDGALQTILGCNGIFKKVVVGSIGTIGSYSSALGGTNYPYEVAAYIDQGHNHVDRPAYTVNVPVTIHYYRKQLTANTFEEVSVYGLRMAYNIRGMTSLGSASDSTLLIPVDHAMVQSYPLAEREVLYSRGLHYVFTSYVRTEVAWYQQEWFGSFLMVVAVVISVIDMGTDGGSIITAAAAFVGTTAAVAMGVLGSILVLMVVNYVKAYLATLFIQAVGVKLGFSIAIIAALAAIYKIYQNGGIKGAPWAKDLLAVSSNLATGVSNTVQGLYGELKGEYDSFSAEADAKNAELDKANELLRPTSLLKPLDIIPGETPTQLYGRCYAGNIGVTSLDAITDYCAVALTLPTLAESTGDISYGLS